MRRHNAPCGCESSSTPVLRASNLLFRSSRATCLSSKRHRLHRTTSAFGGSGSLDSSLYDMADHSRSVPDVMTGRRYSASSSPTMSAEQPKPGGIGTSHQDQPEIEFPLQT